MNIDTEIWQKLREPFGEHQISFKPAMGGTVQAYIDARDVAQRLNEVVGVENWSDSYRMVELEETQDVPVFDYKDGKQVKTGSKKENVKLIGAICELTILGVTKSDLGNPSMAEHLKSSTSDSLKRAAVKFGIGAYLYEPKGLKAGTKFKDLPDFAKPTARSPHDFIMELVKENLNNKKISDLFFTKYKNYLSVIQLRELYSEMKALV